MGEVEGAGACAADDVGVLDLVSETGACNFDGETGAGCGVE